MISVVVACRDPEEAWFAFHALSVCGNSFQAIPVVGAGSILDAYREGQKQAENDLVLYLHQDLLVFEADLETTLRKAITLVGEPGFVALKGNQRPLACGLHWHARDSDVGSLLTLKKGEEGRFISFCQMMIQPLNPGALAMARTAAVVDGCFLATNRRDWNFEPTSRASFLGVYDLDVSMEARSRERTSLVLPLQAIHFAYDLDPDRGRARMKEQFGRVDWEAVVKRWEAWTVPCGIEGCPASKERIACRT